MGAVGGRPPACLAKGMVGGGEDGLQVRRNVKGCCNWDTPGSGSVGEESACNAGAAGDMGSIPGSGRSSGEGHGNPAQYSCLENPHGQRSMVGYSPWGHKELDMTGANEQHGIKTVNTRSIILYQAHQGEERPQISAKLVCVGGHWCWGGRNGGFFKLQGQEGPLTPQAHTLMMEEFHVLWGTPW